MSKGSKQRARREKQKQKQNKQQLGSKVISDSSVTATIPPIPQAQAPPPLPAHTLHTEQALHRPRGRFLKLGVSFSLAAISIGGFAMKAWPNVHVLPPTDVADPLQPYGVEFSIHNSGSLPIYGVEVQCIPYRFSARVTRSEKTAPGPAIWNRRFIADSIPSGESRRFVCNVIKLPSDSIISAVYADAVTLVRFRPISIIPLSWTLDSQAFFTSLEPNGKLRWHEYLPPLQSVAPKYPAQ
jgi:hypothetical protein